MIDKVTALRNIAAEGYRFADDAADEIERLMAKLAAAEIAWKISDKSCYDLTEKVIPNLRDQLEAAEKDIALKERVIDSLGKELNAVAGERDALRANIERTEQQEPVAWAATDESCKVVEALGMNESSRFDTPLYLSPGAQPAPSIPDDVIEQAVSRFLSWKLPKNFHPDGGMVFIPTKGRGYYSPYWPSGTNLLNAQQAREMLRYVLAAAPNPEEKS